MSCASDVFLSSPARPRIDLHLAFNQTWFEDPGSVDFDSFS